MNREELIEKASDAMFTANDGQPDQGYDDMARAALAVFAKAHTPTGDERGAEYPDVAALREARAETWDEAVAAVFAWWSAPEGERPALIVNPYGVGAPINENGETP